MTDRVLISAFAANPEMTSETGIGWSFIRSWAKVALSRDLDVTVVMNERSRLAISARSDELELGSRLRLVGIRVPRAIRILEDPRFTRQEYLAWNALARRQIFAMGANHFLLAHHVTFATDMLPTPIVAADGAFKVWGPVGSSGDPRVFDVPPISRASIREKRRQRVRDSLVRWPSGHYGRQVDLVLAQNDAVLQTYLSRGIRAEAFPNVVLRPEALRELDHAVLSGSPRESRGPRIVSVGHLIPRKRFEIGLSALAHPLLADAEYHIYGKPLEGANNYLPDVARRYGVADRVFFHGKRPRSEVLTAMAEADVLLHPSGREGASGVIGEATVVGIPVVCFSGTGAASVLEQSDGAGVVLQARADLRSREVAEALLHASSQERRRTMMWTEKRFENLNARLLEEARSRRRYGVSK